MNTDQDMPLIARGKVMLSFFADILHDLSFNLPSGVFQASEGRLHLRLTDRHSHFRDEPAAMVFDLTVCNVTSIQVEGRPEDDPGEDMFNDFEFDGKAGVLTLKCCLAIKRIKCSVQRLHIELDQVI